MNARLNQLAERIGDSKAPTPAKIQQVFEQFIGKAKMKKSKGKTKATANALYEYCQKVSEGLYEGRSLTVPGHEGSADRLKYVYSACRKMVGKWHRNKLQIATGIDPKSTAEALTTTLVDRSRNLKRQMDLDSRSPHKSRKKTHCFRSIEAEVGTKLKINGAYCTVEAKLNLGQPKKRSTVYRIRSAFGPMIKVVDCRFKTTDPIQEDALLPFWIRGDLLFTADTSALRSRGLGDSVVSDAAYKEAEEKARGKSTDMVIKSGMDLDGNSTQDEPPARMQAEYGCFSNVTKHDTVQGKLLTKPAIAPAGAGSDDEQVEDSMQETAADVQETATKEFLQEKEASQRQGEGQGKGQGQQGGNDNDSDQDDEETQLQMPEEVDYVSDAEVGTAGNVATLPDDGGAISLPGADDVPDVQVCDVDDDADSDYEVESDHDGNSLIGEREDSEEETQLNDGFRPGNAAAGTVKIRNHAVILMNSRLAQSIHSTCFVLVRVMLHKFSRFSMLVFTRVLSCLFFFLHNLEHTSFRFTVSSGFQYTTGDQC